MTSTATHHAKRAAEFCRDTEHAHWHDQALWFVRAKRDKAARSVPEWETLRELAAAIKTHTMANLADYLEQFERNATARGAVVHWAKDADEHNQIVRSILDDHGAARVVKSKSMLTEECRLNPYLERHGMEVVDTDLGERIMQLRGEPPSHIVLPAIHIRRQEVGELFHERLGTDAGSTDPKYLTEAARQHLRQRFLVADAGITGVNFAVAETGGIVVCTNEGNADLGVALPALHIASMGIEKIVPRAADLGVFLRLLARSATGQPITTYTSHFHGPRLGGQLHLVLVDNGRSQLRTSANFSRSLHCIRCGACMNTCPVYRRSGGYSYGTTIPGPIGSVLGPARDTSRNWSLPFACSLCGSCRDVCPVRIDLDHQLYTWRQEVVARRLLPWTKRWSMKMASLVMRRAWLFGLSGRMARWSLRWLPRTLVYNRLNKWGKQRDLPEPPRRSFRDQYRRGTRAAEPESKQRQQQGKVS